MIFGYSIHSAKRIKERDISKKEIEDAVSNPDRLIRVDDLKKAIKQIGDRVVIVIFKEINGIPFIITAYKSSDVSRYLR